MLREHVAEELRTKMREMDSDSHVQWYIDEFSVDCDASALWPIAAEVAVNALLRKLDEDGIDAQYCDGDRWISVGKLLDDEAEAESEEMAEGVARAWYNADPE